MLRKLGVFSLSLLGLVGISSFVYCAEAPQPEAGPTIGELEEFAAADVDTSLQQAAESLSEGKPFVAKEILNDLMDEELTDAQAARMAELLPKVDAAVAEAEGRVVQAVAPRETAEQEAARQLLEQYRRKWAVEQQLEKARAGELVKEAKQLLYFENRAQEAYDLASKALQLDPENTEAEDIHTEAGLLLDKEPARRKFLIEKGIQLPQVRIRRGFQTLENSLNKARRSYSEGEYEQALEQLRNARFYVELLSVHMDVSSERKEVANLIARVQKDYQEHLRRTAAERQAEARREAGQWRSKIEEEAEKRNVRVVEEITELLEDKEFDAAEMVVEDMAVSDPGDELVPMLRKQVSEARYEHKIRGINAARERGDLSFDLREGERELIPERLYNYPDKKFWQQVVEQRPSEIYPSEIAARGRTPADQQVWDQLGQSLPLQFDETPLPQVVEFLQQVTDINFLVLRRDLPPDQAPVSLMIETTLENGLDQIADLTGMAWKVENGLVKIGAPESLRDYEMRIYPVRDLLVSTEDTGQAQGARGGGAAGGGGGGGGFGPQYTAASAGQISPQFGVGTGGGGGGGAGQQAANVLANRANDIITLIRQSCGQDTWLDPTGTALIGGTGPQGGGGGGPAGFGDGQGAGGFGGFPGGFGAEGGTAQQAMPQGRAFVLASDPGSIVVVQTQQVHGCIESLLKGLRAQMRIQVYVDVRFLSVSNNFFREVGFQWNDFMWDGQGLDGDFGTLDGFGVTGPSVPFDLQVEPSIEPFSIFVPDPANPGEGEFVEVPRGFWPLSIGSPIGDPEWEVDNETGTITFDKLFTTGDPVIGTGLPVFSDKSNRGLNLNLAWSNSAFNLNGMFRLAHERNEVRTLSAPQIMLTNGQQGFLTVSTDFDYVSTFEVDESVLVPEVETVTDEITLQVRPVVAADRRYVFMELAPIITQNDLTSTAQFATFVGQPGGGDGSAAGAEVSNFITLPETTSQSLATTVGVPDRGVVLVGGLSRGTRRHNEAGVPILDKIPIIKRLFSSEGRRLDRSTLFVLAKPTILILSEQEERMQ